MVYQSSEAVWEYRGFLCRAYETMGRDVHFSPDPFGRRPSFNMNAFPPCPQCHADYTYEDRSFYVCPQCAHEWSGNDTAADAPPEKVYRDAAGNVLQDGDTVTVIKDLKLKGSGGVVKIGTKVKNIRLVDADHDIDCKIDGFGPMSLKSEFVKKL